MDSWYSWADDYVEAARQWRSYELGTLRGHMDIPKDALPDDYPYNICYEPGDGLRPTPISTTKVAVTFKPYAADVPVIRKFETGATRDTEDGKPDYEGYLCPLVMKCYGEFMLKHQMQPDGQLRASSNWQKGMPLDAYMSSAWRHFLDWWLHHDGYAEEAKEPLIEALCALLFNVQGYLHELMKSEKQTSP